MDINKLDEVDKIILQRLGTNHASAVELASLAKMTRQAMIKRLNRLLKKGLVRREGGGSATMDHLK